MIHVHLIHRNLYHGSFEVIGNCMYFELHVTNEMIQHKYKIMWWKIQEQYFVHGKYLISKIYPYDMKTSKTISYEAL